NFFLFRVVDTDPVGTLFRGRSLTDGQRAELTRQFGLDGSTAEQFVDYVKQTASLNFGRSYKTNQPVIDEIGAAAWPTIALVGVSTLLSTIFGLLAGIAAAWRRRTRTDYALTSFTMATYSMPDFWLGMLLLTGLAVGLGWFPVGGITDPNSDATGLAHLADQAKHLVLPALTLTVAYLGEYALVMRSSMLDTMREDYLVLARAKGLRDALVRDRHAVPNALLPVVTLIAINFGFVLSGAIAVETIFSWPGLGLATYQSLQGPDLPMLQGLFLLFSAAVILMNLVADLLYAYLDPRVRTA
ncbi:MAG TPA: ABC transporter permease, partial [Gaiellales bacterium]|nr:ABC transporter permease [Gaiellales bacterium]